MHKKQFSNKNELILASETGITSPASQSIIIRRFNEGRKVVPYNSQNTAIHALNQLGLPDGINDLLDKEILINRQAVYPEDYQADLANYFTNIVQKYLQSEVGQSIAYKVLAAEVEQKTMDLRLKDLLETISNSNDFNTKEIEQKLLIIFEMWVQLIGLQDNALSQRMIVWYERTKPTLKGLTNYKELIQDINFVHSLATMLSYMETELLLREVQPLVTICSQFVYDLKQSANGNYVGPNKKEYEKFILLLISRLNKAQEYFQKAYKYKITVELAVGFSEILKLPVLIREKDFAEQLSFQLKKMENFINTWLGAETEESTMLITREKKYFNNPHQNYLRYRALAPSFELLLKKAFFAFSYDKNSIIETIKHLNTNMDVLMNNLDAGELEKLEVYIKVKQKILEISEEINFRYSENIEKDVFDKFLEIIEETVDNKIYALMPLIYETIPSFFNLYLSLFSKNSKETKQALEKYYACLPFNYQYEEQYAALAEFSYDIFKQINSSVIRISFNPLERNRETINGWLQNEDIIAINRTKNNSEFTVYNPNTGRNISIINEDNDLQTANFLENVFQHNKINSNSFLVAKREFMKKNIIFKKVKIIGNENMEKVLSDQNIFSQNPMLEISHYNGKELIKMPASRGRYLEIYKQIYNFSISKNITEKSFVIEKDESAWHGVLIYPEKKLTNSLKNNYSFILKKDPSATYEATGLLSVFKDIITDIKKYIKQAQAGQQQEEKISLLKDVLELGKMPILINKKTIVFSEKEQVCSPDVPSRGGKIKKITVNTKVPFKLAVRTTDEIIMPTYTQKHLLVYFQPADFKDSKSLVVNIRLINDDEIINLLKENISYDNPLRIVLEIR